MSNIQESLAEARLLILGGSGLLGHRLLELLGPRKVVTTYHSSPFAGGVRFDATSMRLRDTLLRAHGDIKAAVILLGNTRLDACARDPLETARVNVEGIRTVIDDLVEAGIKPLFASSDAVFGGEHGMWNENDTPNPILTYGRQKLQVEQHLATKSGPWVIVRLSKVLSHSDEKRNLLGEWSHQIERKESIICATDSIFTPIDSRDAAAAIARLATEDFSGTFHVGGPRTLSRFQLLETLIAAIHVYRDVKPTVICCKLDDLQFAEPRPIDLSMSSRKVCAALNMRLRDPAEVCREFALNKFGARSGSTTAGADSIA